MHEKTATGEITNLTMFCQWLEYIFPVACGYHNQPSPIQWVRSVLTSEINCSSCGLERWLRILSKKYKIIFLYIRDPTSLGSLNLLKFATAESRITSFLLVTACKKLNYLWVSLYLKLAKFWIQPSSLNPCNDLRQTVMRVKLQSNANLLFKAVSVSEILFMNTKQILYLIRY